MVFLTWFGVSACFTAETVRKSLCIYYDDFCDVCLFWTSVSIFSGCSGTQKMFLRQAEVVSWSLRPFVGDWSTVGILQESLCCHSTRNDSFSCPFFHLEILHQTFLRVPEGTQRFSLKRPQCSDSVFQLVCSTGHCKYTLDQQLPQGPSTTKTTSSIIKCKRVWDRRVQLEQNSWHNETHRDAPVTVRRN